MHRLRPWILAALILALALPLCAGPFSFILFWRKGQMKGESRMLRPDQKVEIKDLVSTAPARQKCENWAWAASLETILQTQKVPLPQSYWVLKADGGEVCKDGSASLSSLRKLINGVYILEDGRKVRLEATTVAGAPEEMDAMIDAPRTGRPLMLLWKGHAYLYRGMVYDEMLAPTGQRWFFVKQLELLDPFGDGPEKQAATYNRDQDDPNDIAGMVDVVATAVEGTDWQHPEKELEKPTEIYFPK